MTDSNVNNASPNLDSLRERIDAIDRQLLSLFEQRMDVCASIASEKLATGRAVFDPARERAVLKKVRESSRPDMQSYATVLYSLLMEMSRSHQEKLIHPVSPLKQKIDDALASTELFFPPGASVACQGVEGAYSQLACNKLFKHPNISFFKSFDGVFTAIEEGLCDFGVLPIENSSAGSVMRVYDLMMRHDFHIVRTCRLKVDHDLLAKPGVKLSEIRQIFSHDQALNQCARFIASLDNVRVTSVPNTAEAARMVAQSDLDDVAALSSRACAELYGLEPLARAVNDSGNNFTRFACISKDLKIYPGADRASFMMVLPHEPGSLYKALARFYALDINLTKLESRPIPERDFEFMFYFDFETPVYSPEFAALICEVEDFCESFKYLGSYTELV